MKKAGLVFIFVLMVSYAYSLHPDVHDMSYGEELLLNNIENQKNGTYEFRGHKLRDWFFIEDNIRWFRLMLRKANNFKEIREFNIAQMVDLGYARVVEQDQDVICYKHRHIKYYFYKNSGNKKMVFRELYTDSISTIFYKMLENQLSIFNGSCRIVISGFDGFLIIPDGTVYAFDPLKGLNSIQKKGPIEDFPELSEDAIKVVDAAKMYIGTNHAIEVNGKTFNNDCSGFISAIFMQLGIDLTAGVENVKKRSGYNLTAVIYDAQDYNQHLFYSSQISPGDVIFFSNTYDRNHNRQWDDYFSHIGIVEKVDDKGTVTFIHHINATLGVRRDTMNLMHPDDPNLNSTIRGRNKDDPVHFQYLAGQLCEGFARVFQ